MFKAESCSCSVFEVTLWKESVDGLWACISDVNKGQGGVSAVTEGQQNEQWCTTEYSSCSKWLLSLICYVSLAGWELILSKLDMNMENNYPILWALYYWEATNMLIISLNWHSLKFKQYSQVLCLILLLDTVGIIFWFRGQIWLDVLWSEFTHLNRTGGSCQNNEVWTPSFKGDKFSVPSKTKLFFKWGKALVEFSG